MTKIGLQVEKPIKKYISMKIYFLTGFSTYNPILVIKKRLLKNDVYLVLGPFPKDLEPKKDYKVWKWSKWPTITLFGQKTLVFRYFRTHVKWNIAQGRALLLRVSWSPHQVQTQILCSVIDTRIYVMKRIPHILLCEASISAIIVRMRS